MKRLRLAHTCAAVILALACAEPFDTGVGHLQDLRGRYTGTLAIDVMDTTIVCSGGLGSGFVCAPGSLAGLRCGITVDLAAPEPWRFQGTFTVDTIGGCPWVYADGAVSPQIGLVPGVLPAVAGAIASGIVDTMRIVTDGQGASWTKIRFTAGLGGADLAGLLGCQLSDTRGAPEWHGEVRWSPGPATRRIVASIGPPGTLLDTSYTFTCAGVDRYIHVGLWITE